MMKARTPTISATRLASLRWFVLVCIARLMPWLSNRGVLNAATRVAANVVILGVASRTTSPPRSNHRHGVKKTRGHRRAVIGQHLRKALRGSRTVSRLDAILSVLRNPERCIAMLMRRLRKGLTRRRLVRVFRDDPFAPTLAMTSTPSLNSS
jgi:hypothetical protein